ncbi:hypothetical protein QL285_067244 [Trifolium repens]|nr:hypothetical protein QL285_067244 [Trifolium repens]
MRLEYENIISKLISLCNLTSLVRPSIAWERHIDLPSWKRPVNRWMRDAKMHHLYFKHFFSLSLSIISVTTNQLYNLVPLFFLYAIIFPSTPN